MYLRPVTKVQPQAKRDRKIVYKQHGGIENCLFSQVFLQGWNRDNLLISFKKHHHKEREKNAEAKGRVHLHLELLTTQTKSVFHL